MVGSIDALDQKVRMHWLVSFFDRNVLDALVVDSEMMDFGVVLTDTLTSVMQPVVADH